MAKELTPKVHCIDIDNYKMLLVIDGGGKKAVISRALN